MKLLLINQILRENVSKSYEMETIFKTNHRSQNISELNINKILN